MSVRVFLDEINIWVSSLSNQMALLNVGGPHAIHWRPEKNKRLRKRGFTLSAWRSSSWNIVFYCLWTQTQTGTYSIGSPGSQAFGLQTVGLLSLHSYVSQFLKTNKQIGKLTNKYLLLVLFLWRTLTDAGLLPCPSQSTFRLQQKMGILAKPRCLQPCLWPSVSLTVGSSFLALSGGFTPVTQMVKMVGAITW